jgi:hypothetical protein
MTEPKSTHPLASVSGIVAAAVSWVLSEYCGMSFWIPGAATIILSLLFLKTALRPKLFVGAIAVTGGHIIWFIIGSIIADIWRVTALDIIALSLGVAWLWLRPSLYSALFLGFIQLASLVVNLISLKSATFGGFAHRALTAHCVFRLLAIVLLICGYIEMRKKLLSQPEILQGGVQPNGGMLKRLDGE